jgi:hypothetical protein
MKNVLIATAVAASLLAGCASVPMDTPENDKLAKEFNPPSEGNSGLYIYRASGPGTALKKSIWVNDKCVGESAQNVFFYEEVMGGQEHKVSTESEFSPNDLLVQTEPDHNYFINQYIKIGAFVGGANLKLVDEEKGKEKVSKLKMAVKGNCGK